MARDQKIQSIVNLRSPEESGFRDRLSLAQQLRLRYLSVPIAPVTITTLDDAGWDKVLASLDLAPHPALVHWFALLSLRCSASSSLMFAPRSASMTRATLATIMYSVTRHLMTFEEAEKKVLFCFACVC